MSETFELEIATPERLLVREQVVSAQVPAENGYLGVLPDHAPLFAQLGIGALSYITEAQSRVAVLVSQGFIEVRDNHARVLADSAEMASEIDAAAAEKALAEVHSRWPTRLPMPIPARRSLRGATPPRAWRRRRKRNKGRGESAPAVVRRVMVEERRLSRPGRFSPADRSTA